MRECGEQEEESKEEKKECMALKISQTVRKGETRVEGGREGLLHVPGFPFPFWEFFTLGLAAVARGEQKT